jgi:hypothetical protein
MTIRTFPVFPFEASNLHEGGTVYLQSYAYRLERRPHFSQCQPLLNAYEVVMESIVSMSFAGRSSGRLENTVAIGHKNAGS